MIKYPLSYNPILDYYGKIENHEIVVCKKIEKWYKYLAWHIEHPDEYFYSVKRANHILEFAENFCKLSKHKKGTTNDVKLELWEKAYLATIFGFIDHKGIRQYRESILIVGKKNGKSLLASIIGDYMLIGDGEPGPEVYAVATKREQAMIVWTEAKRMVNKSPVLRKRIKPLVNMLSSEAFNEGFFKPLASDKDSMDGLNVHCCLMDEIHQWKNGKALYDIMADGTTARDQPLISITSTAGTVRKDIYDKKYDEASRIINGLFDDKGYKDPHTAVFIYELDKREEWTDEKCWIKANPGLGTIKSITQLRDKVRKAQEDSTLVKNLVCKEFNIRETSDQAWLTFEDADNEDTFKLDLKNRQLIWHHKLDDDGEERWKDITLPYPKYGIGGTDLSKTTDLTSASVTFMVPECDRIFELKMYWIPEDLVEKHVKEDKVPYDIWISQGYCRTCPGNKNHPKFVTQWLLEIQNELDIYIPWIGYDAWSAQYWVEEMQGYFGKESMIAVHQGKQTLSGPMKVMGADLQSNKLIYNNNPITKWCLCNTAIDIDKNGNMQPIKAEEATKRIDGTAALLDSYVVLEEKMNDYLSMI